MNFLCLLNTKKEAAKEATPNVSPSPVPTIYSGFISISSFIFILIHALPSLDSRLCL